MTELRDCSVCFNGDPIHNIKCCFNCVRDSDICEVCHSCGKDCPGWAAKTNADEIRSMDDEELSAPLCFSGWESRTRKECLEWLNQPTENSIK